MCRQGGKRTLSLGRLVSKCVHGTVSTQCPPKLTLRMCVMAMAFNISEREAVS